MGFFQNTRKPDGLGGKLMVKMMNSGHSALARWGFSHVRVQDGAAIQAGRCTVVQGDVSRMPSPAGKFDFVSAFETIYFWPGLEPCFAEVHRVLKPGGTFLICNELDGTDDYWTKVVEGMRVYTAEQICAALKQAGFSEPECHEEGKKHWLCILARKN